MKFFKNNLKVIIGFIVGVILASSITVYAYSCVASEVKYINPETNAEISVEAALNDLYSKQNKTSGEKVFESLMETVQMSHNSNASVGKTGSFTWKNIDFSNIQSFDFIITSLSGATTDVGFSLTNINPSSSNIIIFFKDYQLNTNHTINMNNINNCDFAMFVSIDTATTFKIVSYTTTDGIVHTK